jgi:hypothetical protein
MSRMSEDYKDAPTLIAELAAAISTFNKASFELRRRGHTVSVDLYNPIDSEGIGYPALELLHISRL